MTSRDGEMRDYSAPGSYQAAEVEWYRKNGRHPSRICIDNTGKPYVVGDDDWNKSRRAAEYIERDMTRALGRGI